jgi:hypothetical protein
MVCGVSGRRAREPVLRNCLREADRQEPNGRDVVTGVMTASLVVVDGARRGDDATTHPPVRGGARPADPRTLGAQHCSALSSVDDHGLVTGSVARRGDEGHTLGDLFVTVHEP